MSQNHRELEAKFEDAARAREAARLHLLSVEKAIREAAPPPLEVMDETGAILGDEGLGRAAGGSAVALLRLRGLRALWLQRRRAVAEALGLIAAEDAYDSACVALWGSLSGGLQESAFSEWMGEPYSQNSLSRRSLVWP